MRVAKSRVVSELLPVGKRARIVRYWRRGGSNFEYVEEPVPERISGWRKVERQFTRHVIFEGGSHLHPHQADVVDLTGNNLTLSFHTAKIEYELG